MEFYYFTIEGKNDVIGGASGTGCGTDVYTMPILIPSYQ
jgi:hypothetical protein